MAGGRADLRTIPVLALLVLVAGTGAVFFFFSIPGGDEVIEPSGTDPRGGKNTARDAGETGDPSESGRASEASPEKDIAFPEDMPVPQRNALRRLIRALGSKDAGEILEALDGALEFGLPPREAAGILFDCSLPLDDKCRLLEHLVRSGFCTRNDRITIAWYFHYIGIEGNSTSALEKAFALHPDQIRFLRVFFDADPEAALEALKLLEPERMSNPRAIEAVLRFLKDRKARGLLASFALRLFTLVPTHKLAFGILMEMDPESMLSRLEKAVRENPEDPDAWAGWGMAQMASGRTAQAFEAFEKAASLDPESPEYLQGLIETDPIRAVEALQALAKEHPENEEVTGKLGRALIGAGRREEAFGVLLKALENEPEDPEWMDMLLRIEPRRTCETLREWAGKDPKDDILQGILGRALHETGDRGAAFDAYARAFRILEIPVWAHGMVEAEPARALPVLKTYLRLTPERLASIQARLASSRVPLEPSDVFDRMRPGDCNVLGELGLAWLKLGNMAEGAPLIDFALNSGHVGGEQASVLIGAIGKADPARGQRILNRMASVAGHEPEAWGRVGDGYREMGLIPEALEAYRKARAFDPTNEEWITAIQELEWR